MKLNILIMCCILLVPALIAMLANLLFNNARKVRKDRLYQGKL